MFTRIARWLSTERRQGIQLAAASVVPLLVLMGFGTQEVWEQWLLIFGAALAFTASLLSLVNLKRGDFGTGWAIVRGAIYVLAAAAAPSLVALGFLSTAQSELYLGALTTVLTSVSAIVAVFTSSLQQQQETRDAVLNSIPKYSRTGYLPNE